MCKVDVLKDRDFITKVRKFYWKEFVLERLCNTPLKLHNKVLRAQVLLKIIVESGKENLLSNINSTLKEEANNVLVQDLVKHCDVVSELAMKPNHRFRMCETEASKFERPFIIAYQAYFDYLAKRKKISASIKKGIEYSKKEFYWSAGEVAKVKNFLRSIFKRTNNSVKLQDNYLDDSVLEYIECLKKNVNIFILTKQLDNKVLDKIKNSNNKRIKIRQNDLCHDRFIIIDQSLVWSIGPSIKNIGKKAGMINLIENRKKINHILKDFQSWWNLGIDLI